MRDRPAVHCAYCDQRLEIGDRGQLVAVGGRGCTGPRHSPRGTCDRCGEPVHVDFGEPEVEPQSPAAEYLRHLSRPASRLVDEHGSADCPVGGADGHSLHAPGERTDYWLALVGFVLLCLAAIAFFVLTANDNGPTRGAPAGARTDATHAVRHR